MGLSFALEGNAPVAEQWLRRAAAQPGAGPGVTQNLDLVLQLQGKETENRMAEAPAPAPQFAQQPTWGRANVQGPNASQNRNATRQPQGQQSPFAPRSQNVPQNTPQNYSTHFYGFSIF